MLSSKAKDHFIKFVNKNIHQDKTKTKSGALEPNAIQNSIMKTIHLNQISTIKLGRFLKLLPKKTLVNIPLLVEAFLELEKDGWIEIQSNNFIKTLVSSGREWIPLPTKKTKQNFDIDLALIGVYDDEKVKMATNPLINEKICQNEKTLKTVKNLNEKQIDVVDHLNVIQNWFLNEFLIIFLAEKKETFDSQVTKKIIDLQEYNEKVLDHKLKQMMKKQKGKNFDLLAMEKNIDDCLNGRKLVCPEFEGLNKKTQQKLTSRFQTKIHQEGIDNLFKKMSLQYPSLLNFFKN